MALIQNRNGIYKLVFYHHNKRHYVTLGKVSDQEVETKVAAVDYLMLRVRQGLVDIPPGVPVEEFVLADGKVKAPKKARAEAINVARLCDCYLKTHRNGAMEKNSLVNFETYMGYVARTFGDGFSVAKLALGDLQRHVDARSKAKYRVKPISPATIKKELATFRAVWNWAERMGLVVGTFPSRGLVYPKTDEKPPF